MDVPHTARTPKWQQLIWLGAGLALLLMILGLLGFAVSTIKSLTTIIINRTEGDAGFVFASTTAINLTLLRLLAILVGATIAFAGLAVSFFVQDKAITLDTQVAKQEVGNAKLALATHSPGIIGVLAGTLIIGLALFARSNYSYQTPVPAIAGTVPATGSTGSASNAIDGPSVNHVRSAEEVLAQPAAVK
jgi:hypothetical protein